MQSLAILLFCATPLAQGDPGGFAARVNEAIDRGAAWLKSRQRPDGKWDDAHNDRFASGVAALGFLTLVKSGVAESDPAVARSIRYFDDFRAFDKTYSTGVLIMAWEALKRGAADRPRAAAAAQWLREHRDAATKLWAYPDGEPDLSNTQYALLGLHAASRMGVAIPKDFLWETIEAIAKRRMKEGSFTYKSGEPIGTGSMTTAAISDLRIAALELKGFGPYESKRAELDAAEKGAFEWLEKRFRVDANPAGYGPRGSMRGWHHYFLYALERACTLAGRAKLAGKSWYREGAEYLLATQEPAGTWENDLTKTCFALLFLKRATLTWAPDPAKGNEEYVGAANVDYGKPPAPKSGVPFLKRWLVAGSFPFKRGEPFGKDEIGEASIRDPKAGERAGLSTKKWIAAEIAGPALSLDKVLPPFDDAFAYAWTTISSKKEQDAVLWLGHDDGARVWLNGKLVYENESYVDGLVSDFWCARVRLKVGENTLLAKVYDIGYFCDLSVRVASPQGDPIE